MAAVPRPRDGILTGLAFAAALAATPAEAQRTIDCTADLARIRKAESELPRLEAAPPNDGAMVCITLETNVLFARHFAAHVKACPQSPYASHASFWSKTRSSYSAQFNSRGCKATIRSYRG